jgi:hypothetical protein
MKGCNMLNKEVIDGFAGQLEKEAGLRSFMAATSAVKRRHMKRMAYKMGNSRAAKEIKGTAVAGAIMAPVAGYQMLKGAPMKPLKNMSSF